MPRQPRRPRRLRLFIGLVLLLVLGAGVEGLLALVAGVGVDPLLGDPLHKRGLNFLTAATGQDGLVANAAKYLTGQLVLGVNPDPELYDGVLVPHEPGGAARLLKAMAVGRAEVEERTMAEARLDDGQRLLALNELFAGHRSHQSARYRIALGGSEERQSSSGVIVATGTGATGWARSINRERRRALDLPRPGDPAVAFFVREPFPSVGTGSSIDGALLAGDEPLELVSEMNEGGVIFGDGIEDDRLEFTWGTRARIRAAAERLRLVKSA